MTSDDNKYMVLIDAFTELQPELDLIHRHKQQISSRPSLSHVLSDFGPMPQEALFLGVASDELPVLLNLHDPVPGPLLIVGDSQSGKTQLLTTIALAVEKMHQPENVQFGVVTARPDEWREFEESDTNVGVFHLYHRSAEDFILSLASWAHGNKTGKQSVLLLLDDLEAVTNMEPDAVHNLRWLLLRGPARRVWPIITLDSKKIGEMEGWLAAFRTRILGKVQSDNYIQKLDAMQAGLQELLPGSDFALREGNQWLKFWIPSQG